MEKSLVIKISALDRLTAPAVKMRESLNRLGEPVRRINTAVGRLGDATGVTKLAGKFKALGRHITDVRSRIGGLLGSVASLAGVSLVGGGGGLLAGVIKTSAEFERYETVLTSTMGTSAKAKKAMGWISEFARKTPYELAEVTDAFVKLKSYGIDGTDGTLASLGDAAAAMNKSLDQVVEALADARTGEFERLKDLGIRARTQGDIVSLLFTDKEGRARTFKAAKDDARALQKAVLDAFDAKGFTGASARLSRTWDGLVSNIKDTFSRFFLAIGQAGIFDYLKSRMAGLLELFERVSKDGRLQAWAKRISDEMIRLAVTLEGFIRSIDWGKTYAGLKAFAEGVSQFVNLVGGWRNAIIGLVVVLNAGLIVSLVQLGAMLVGLIPAIVSVGLSVAATMLSIGAALIASPIFWVAAAVAGLAFLVVKNWEPLKAWFAGLWGGITAAAQGTWAFLTGLLKWAALFSPLGLVLQGLRAIVQTLFGVDLFDVGGRFFGRLWDGLKAKWAEISAWFAGAVQRLTGWLPEGIKSRMGLQAPKAAQAPTQVRRIANPPAVRKVVAATAAAGAIALPTALAASPAITSVARPGEVAARRQASAPAAPGRLQPASVTQQVHAPVQVAVTINGLADVAVVQRTVDTTVRRAIADWEARQRSDRVSALYDT